MKMIFSRLLGSLVLLLHPLGTGMQGTCVSPAKVMRGVDVSHYQKRIEWDSVAVKEPIDFAFVKATEGHEYVDSLFCRNWDSLRKHGIRRGAYHFFRAYGCGEEQARNFLQCVDFQPGDLAPVLDLERTDGVDPDVMIQEASVWLQYVEKQLGVKPIIYSGFHFYENYLKGHFDHYPLWIARYADEAPLLTSGKRWDFWQYSNEGCLEGISQKVDLNVFPGTPEMLEKLCWYPVKEEETAEARVTP
ncbi:MAG: glycoside hydrolase family 25 protein [Saprospiraceae bacterium]|nr:glycoside hydrolase family 25 protein [Saprospiraceae bacterium]